MRLLEWLKKIFRRKPRCQWEYEDGTICGAKACSSSCGWCGGDLCGEDSANHCEEWYLSIK